MLDIVKSSTIRNGNGADGINGRGILRRKLSNQERIALGADVALGLIHIRPSIKQSAADVGVSPAKIRAELKARTQAQEIAKIANSAAVETVVSVETPTNGTAAETNVTSTMPDTPEVRVSLRRWAASLGCEIMLLDEEPTAGVDYGPYVLVHACGHLVWEFGLSVEGIADALKCFAREQQLPYDRIGEAWADFGSTWRL